MFEVDMETVEAPATCPVCGSSKFTPGGQTVELPQILTCWEEVVGCVFADDLKAYYGKPERAHSTLFTCGACGFELFFPTVTGTADFYDRIEVANYYNLEKWEFQRALQFIRNLGVAALLDIGCGAGAFLDRLRSAAPEVRRCGHELNPKLRSILEANQHEVVFEPLASMAADQFDVVTAFQILEHTADPVAMLRAMFALVRPGGFVFISTPNQSGPIRHFSGALTEIPPHHVSRWTPRALLLAVRQAGFSDCRLGYEPLARVLWDTYLPVVMDADCWVRSMFGCFVDHLEPVDRASFLNRELQRTDLLDLYGVVGQSIMVMARKPAPQ